MAVGCKHDTGLFRPHQTVWSSINLQVWLPAHAGIKYCPNKGEESNKFISETLIRERCGRNRFVEFWILLQWRTLQIVFRNQFFQECHIRTVLGTEIGMVEEWALIEETAVVISTNSLLQIGTNFATFNVEAFFRKEQPCWICGIYSVGTINKESDCNFILIYQFHTFAIYYTPNYLSWFVKGCSHNTSGNI